MLPKCSRRIVSYVLCEVEPVQSYKLKLNPGNKYLEYLYSVRQLDTTHTTVICRRHTTECIGEWLVSALPPPLQTKINGRHQLLHS